jgi:hypothetical protein
MSGLFGTGASGSSLASFDFSVLGDYYQAKAQLRSVGASAAQPTAAAKAKATGDVVSFAPWDQRSAEASDISKLRDALGAASFVDLSDDAFNRTGVDQEHKKLFALYVGLSRLQALANRASAEATPLAELTGLNRRVQQGLAEISTYLGKTAFNDMTLLFGKRESQMQSAFKVARAPTQYTGPSIVSGAATNAIPGLAGNEVFTVSALKGGATTDVVMDLSEISSDVSVSSVIAYMNGKMEAAGLSTRFKTTIFEGKTENDAKRYGIGVQTVATERVSFAAAATKPAVYVAGVAGPSATQTGQLMKLTDEGTSVSANFSTKIAGASGATDAKATTTDVNGNVYVVGSVTDDLGNGIVQGDQDVYLRKYDAAGQLVWSRLVGSSERASGFALATDTNGNVAIAGKVTDRLTSNAVGRHACRRGGRLSHEAHLGRQFRLCTPVRRRGRRPGHVDCGRRQRRRDPGHGRSRRSQGTQALVGRRHVGCGVGGFAREFGAGPAELDRDRRLVRLRRRVDRQRCLDRGRAGFDRDGP